MSSDGEAEFIGKLEGLGVESVRHRLTIGAFGEEVWKKQAQSWLDRKDREASEAALASQMAANSLQATSASRAADSTRDLAEHAAEANRLAERANTRATIANVIAVIAMIVSIIALYRGS